MDSLDLVTLFFAVLLIATMGTLWRLARLERAEVERKRAAAAQTLDETAMR